MQGCQNVYLLHKEAGTWDWNNDQIDDRNRSQQVNGSA
jgi:hypothetical protein